jgi:hypothetical protein
MFKRFLDVYGNQFQPFLGDKQYISDPFWNRVLPKEDEIKEIREQEKADQKMSIGIELNYTQKKNAAKNKKLEINRKSSRPYKNRKQNAKSAERNFQSIRNDIRCNIGYEKSAIFPSSCGKYRI